MAEFAVNTVLENIKNLLVQEAAHLVGVSDKVQQLRDELRWMQSFLKDAEPKQEENELFRNWVSEIRDVAYDAEEVIEKYISKAASNRKRDFITKPVYLRKVSKQIEKIKSRIQEISSHREKYVVVNNSRERAEGSSASERLKWWRQPSPNVEKDDLIELVEDTQVLLAQLNSIEQKRQVVSIVGMGGLGKTTLAKRLYNHVDVKNHFECRAWVYVSKEYRRREILQGIIMDAIGLTQDEVENLDKLREEELIKRLHDLLDERRYLVVLDDMWNKEAWDGLETAFPNGKSGSKVMITTRNKEVALHAGAGNIPHEPRILTKEESIELLRKKAFTATDNMPSELEELGREMVAKCDGLPLAVVVLGGLLSRKTKSTAEWQRILRNISWHLIKGEDRIAAVLALSYNDLPSHLQSCFLYLGLFPEDFPIQRKRAIRLWVAEGFLPQEGEETTEGVAENCLNELIDRCMIQVASISSLGRVKTFRIHELLRDLSISKGREENFLEVYRGNGIDFLESHQKRSRRHAIHSYYDKYTFLKHSAPVSRSLLFFNQYYKAERAVHQMTDYFQGQVYNMSFELEKKLSFIYKYFKKLRVLDLEGVHIVSLPTTIGNLNQLRYLGLKNTDIRELPSSVGKLQNLQTLDLRDCSFLERIPNVIWKMVRLRHLLLYTPDSGHLKTDTLTSLQTLPYIEAGRWIEDGGLENMINLRQLGVDGLSREQVNSVLSIVGRLQHLQWLSLLLQSGEEAFPTQMRFSQCDHLLKLVLCGKIEKLPDPYLFPPNLIKLTLYDSDLQKDSISTLGRLPKLKMLVMDKGSYNLSKMKFSSEGFPRLEILRLQHLQNLKDWILEEGAMPRLKHLVINSCYKLENIPKGLKLITTFKELEILGMPVDFIDRLRSDLLEFRPSVKLTTDTVAIEVSAAGTMLVVKKGTSS